MDGNWLLLGWAVLLCALGALFVSRPKKVSRAANSGPFPFRDPISRAMNSPRGILIGGLIALAIGTAVVTVAIVRLAS